VPVRGTALLAGRATAAIGTFSPMVAPRVRARGSFSSFYTAASFACFLFPSCLASRAGACFRLTEASLVSKPKWALVYVVLTAAEVVVYDREGDGKPQRRMQVAAISKVTATSCQVCPARSSSTPLRCLELRERSGGSCFGFRRRFLCATTFLVQPARSHLDTPLLLGGGPARGAAFRRGTLGVGRLDRL
jgi:hypothetical protein